MIYQISIQTLKPSIVCFYYGIMIVVFLHLFRKKFEDISPAFLLAILTSFASTMIFYGFNPLIWIEQSKAFYLHLTKTIGGGVISWITVIGLLAVFMSLPRLITERLSMQELRSFYHLTYGIMIVFFLSLSAELAFFILSISLTLFIVLEYLRESDDTSVFVLFLKRSMNKAMKGQEIRGYIATLFYLIGLILVILFLPVQYVMGCALILTVGDPTAVLIGKRFGKYKWNHNPDKSLEGSVAMFLVILLALQILRIPIMTTVCACAGATFFESLKLEISDNLMVPIVSGLIMMSI